jgi:broad specificity phosphatase PhoE
MVQIVLILPGSTDFDAQRRIQGNLDVPLNEQGAAEVGRIAEEIRPLNVAVVYGACCEPAAQTAKVIAKALGVKVRRLDRLNNQNQGLWQGMLVDEVRTKQPKVYRLWQENPECVCPPEGEMLGQVADRVEAALTKLLKRHREGVVALVAPEPLASLVRRFVHHGVLGDLWKAGAEHGRWEVLDVNPEALVASG